MDARLPLLLPAAATLLAAGFTLLFAVRGRHGASPFYLCLGAVQLVYAALLGAAVDTPDPAALAAAGGLCVPATLFCLALVRLDEGAEEARRLARGLVLLNVGLAVAGCYARCDAVGPGVRIGFDPRPDFRLLGVIGVGAVALGVAAAVLREPLHRATRGPAGFAAGVGGFVLAAGSAQVFVAAVAAPRELGVGPVVAAGLLPAAVFGCAAAGYAARGRTAGGGLVSYRERYEALRVEVERDPLTGLYNRRFFDDTLARELATAARYGTPLSLLLIDVDRFKRVNDRFGHLEGDRVLRILGEVLPGCVRSDDFACRYAGDEFAVLLPNAGPATAAALAAKIRAAFRVACGKAVPRLANDLTLTIGLATAPADAGTPDELVRAADERLYRGKAAGRNRVVGGDLRPGPSDQTGSALALRPG